MLTHLGDTDMITDACQICAGCPIMVHLADQPRLPAWKVGRDNRCDAITFAGSLWAASMIDAWTQVRDF